MNARKYALEILDNIYIKGAYSNIAINKQLEHHSFEAIDRRFITELVYGVIENQIYLDFIIDHLSKTKINKLDLSILNILRMGLYQLIYLDKVPDSAAVNESVKLAKQKNVKASGFVNGLLRNYLRNKNNIELPNPSKDLVKYLSIKYSHPLWLVQKWVGEYGQEFTEALLSANNQTPPLSIRMNTLKMNKEEAVNILAADGIKGVDGLYVEEALHIENISSIDKLKSYENGYFTIQDESSMLVAHVVNPLPGEFVIDVCSAPGGKSTHMAQLMKNQGKILSRDIYDHKLKLIRAAADRLGISIIETERFDAKVTDAHLIEKADKVLVDAPCSGLGIIRRKPEIKYTRKAEDFQTLAALQLEILEAASHYVKPGGYLIYSTCTIAPEENMGVVEAFIRNNQQFKLIDINELLPEKLQSNNAYLQLYPNTHNIDGFFICKMQKVFS
ncbi:MAG: 16S rRNA (cytosine(967)-C(5))-methyltransferase RsmB [Bacillota bacterium]